MIAIEKWLEDADNLPDNFVDVAGLRESLVTLGDFPRLVAKSSDDIPEADLRLALRSFKEHVAEFFQAAHLQLATLPVPLGTYEGDLDDPSAIRAYLVQPTTFWRLTGSRKLIGYPEILTCGGLPAISPFDLIAPIAERHAARRLLAALPRADCPSAQPTFAELDAPMRCYVLNNDSTAKLSWSQAVRFHFILSAHGVRTSLISVAGAPGRSTPSSSWIAR